MGWRCRPDVEELVAHRVRAAAAVAPAAGVVEAPVEVRARAHARPAGGVDAGGILRLRTRVAAAPARVVVARGLVCRSLDLVARQGHSAHMHSASGRVEWYSSGQSSRKHLAVYRRAANYQSLENYQYDSYMVSLRATVVRTPVTVCRGVPSKN